MVLQLLHTNPELLDYKVFTLQDDKLLFFHKKGLNFEGYNLTNSTKLDLKFESEQWEIVKRGQSVCTNLSNLFLPKDGWESCGEEIKSGDGFKMYPGIEELRVKKCTSLLCAISSKKMHSLQKKFKSWKEEYISKLKQKVYKVEGYRKDNDINGYYTFDKKVVNGFPAYQNNNGCTLQISTDGLWEIEEGIETVVKFKDFTLYPVKKIGTVNITETTKGAKEAAEKKAEREAAEKKAEELRLAAEKAEQDKRAAEKAKQIVQEINEKKDPFDIPDDVPKLSSTVGLYILFDNWELVKFENPKPTDLGELHITIFRQMLVTKHMQLEEPVEVTIWRFVKVLNLHKKRTIVCYLIKTQMKRKNFFWEKFF